MEHLGYGSTDNGDIVIDDAELYELGHHNGSFELDKISTQKNESIIDRKESWIMRIAQLVLITIIAAVTRIIVFFTLEI